MAEIVRMPLMSDTMIEGVIVEWHKNVGDTVESSELLAEIETDKATMEFEAPEDGVLLFRAEMNVPIPVNDILAIIGETGESIDAILAEEKAKKASEGAAKEAEESTPPPPPPAPVVTASPIAPPAPQVQVAPAAPVMVANNNNGRIKASPLAKSLAKSNQVDISLVAGTGDEGRIIKRDIEAYIANRSQAPAPAVGSPAAAPVMPMVTVSGQESFEEVRVSQMRKTIARRLGESKFQAPHFYLTIQINMDKMMVARKSMNAISPVKISFNDIVVKAAAVALRQHPAVNSSWLGDKIRYNHHINIGVAVAVDEGLLVPVLRFADQKSLSQLGTETRALAAKAKEKSLQPAEMQGNTFTISNLGMFGIEEFTAIINPPDSCIMAVGGIAKVPAVIDDEIKIAHLMKVTLSCDHRVVDGATGAKFLQTFKGVLEEPLGLLI